MPKLKTHSGAKKRFNLTKTGKVKRAKAFKSHILTKKTTKRKRNFRQEGELMEKSVQMHLIIDVGFIYLAVDHIFHILSHPFLIRFPRRGKPRWALS